jgi:putative ABC transport system permease protein
MLQLHSIKKDYLAGTSTVHALRGIDVAFREHEFVSILGQSGCGKTTLLNIIGGLDQYTSGDLVINGVSTKEFKDRDWDTYRNHTIGFVFQSYNLIPHQTVLRNVELALTLSGVSKAERRRRAQEALEKVGLGDQLHKKPNQMSGGQMQRVAIARALVNDPDILLADEPTGALDSETSVQVMEILKEIARDKLVVMVTHNPELAQTYSTRIIRLLDGQVIDDSDPFTPAQADLAPADKAPKAKTSMSFLTALSLSLNNLLTKKGRTLLTAFAGSIGIIGIALILSLSNGIQTYIDQVQEETLSSYPITIQAESVDMSAMMLTLMGNNRAEATVEHEPDRVYSSSVMYDMMDSMLNMETETNNLAAFKTWLDSDDSIADLATIQYSYDLPFNVYTRDEEGTIVQSDITALMQQAMGALYGGDYSTYFDTMGSLYSSMNVWQELLGDEDGLVSDQVRSQYDMIYGQWPENYNEVVLFVDENNEISDLMLVSLGLVPSSQLDATMAALQNGEMVDLGTNDLSWSYEELCQLEYRLILPAECYQYDSATDSYTDLSATDAGLELLYGSDDVGTTLKVVGIARPAEDATSSMVTGAIGYTTALTTYAIETTAEAPVMAAQLADPDTDVLTGLPFVTDDAVEPTDAEKAEAVTDYLAQLSVADKAAAYLDVAAQPEQAVIDAAVEQQMAQMDRDYLETVISQQYADEMGVDADTVTAYIAQMDDDTLFSMVAEELAEAVRQQYAAEVQSQLAALTTEQLAAMLDAGGFTEAQYAYLYETYLPAAYSESTYEDNLDLLGYVDLDSPATISLYATTFADKDAIADRIAAYNDTVGEDDEISYTDYVALLMSSITTIINGISYVLIAFVSISLVVSSIMIGIITYISVLERTKEIGILRAIGASKKDISRVFNAETLIIGLCAGLIGIGITVLLNLPITAVVQTLSGITALKSSLPLAGGVALVVISALLTILAGLIPAKVAAKKDPVVALRTE